MLSTILQLGFVAQDTIDTLDSINFDWDPRSSKFERRFEELKAFKAQYGHCNVPVTYHENPNLGTWYKLYKCFRVDGYCLGVWIYKYSLPTLRLCSPNQVQ